MKSLAAIAALSVLTIVSAPAPAWAGPGAKDWEMKLEQITGRGPMRLYGVRLEGDACFMLRSLRRSPSDWVKRPAKACLEVRKAYEAKASALAPEALKQDKLAVPPGAQWAILRVGEKEWAADLMTAKTCDRAGLCTEPELSEASKLGVVLRDAITRELGR